MRSRWNPYGGQPLVSSLAPASLTGTSTLQAAPLSGVAEIPAKARLACPVALRVHVSSRLREAAAGALPAARAVRHMP